LRLYFLIFWTKVPFVLSRWLKRWSHLWVRDLTAGLSVPALVQYLHLWNKIAGVHLLEDEAESFKWIWTTSSDFSVKSAYLAFFEGRTLWPLRDPIWKCRAPLKFKLFVRKVVWNCCWTGDRRFRHGLYNDDSCTFVFNTPRQLSIFFCNALFQGAFGLRS
jgi:hypothetical protein